MFPGLFSSAICESATALSPWAYQRFQKEISYALLKMLNKDFNNHQANSSEILQYLKTAPAKDIDKASHAIYLWVSKHVLHFLHKLKPFFLGFTTIFTNSTRLFLRSSFGT